jgi:competence protein ComEC
MTAFPKLAILDVGHGNSAVLHDRDAILVFDAGLGNILYEYILENNIQEIEALLISHSDADHLAGAINLLSAPRFRVKSVYLNPDARNQSETFASFRSALRDAKENRNTQVHTQLNTTISGAFRPGITTVEILAPDPETALSGPGGQDLRGRPVNANNMSAVIRLLVNGKPLVLLPGDMDAVGLSNLVEHYSSLPAKVLLFPHHGGLPGRADPSSFAVELCKLVQPKLIVFFIGRGKHNTPNPTIVEAIMTQCPATHIACTQLSRACASDLPNAQPTHLAKDVALGRSTRSCCIGTIVLPLPNVGETLPVLNDHRDFVDRFAPTALCRRRSPDRL